MIESSATDEPAKLLPISMKVGKLPVVNPLILCNVVVGGSAWALNIKERSGNFAVSSCGKVRTLWWYGDVGSGGEGDMKSKRKASITRKTSRG